ncbi:MAG: NAD(P)-dependent oxidoreductase [Caldilineaceae bacterium]
MKILLTGANGFIGRHLLERLAGEHQLVALVRQLPARLIAGVEYIAQDLSQPLQLAQLPSQLDAIIHQAALIDTERFDESLAFRVNVEATWRLLHYAEKAGVHTFVHASTGGVYGCADRPFVESDPFHPMDLYSLTKAQAELAVQASAGDFHKVVLRYFFPYGAGTPNPIPRWVERALSGEPLQVLRSGKPHLNPLHISDAVEATVRALALRQSAVLNIAGTEITSIRGIAEMAAQRVGRKANLELIPDESAIPYYRADLVAKIERMQTLLHFTPQITLAQGIAELVQSQGMACASAVQ